LFNDCTILLSYIAKKGLLRDWQALNLKNSSSVPSVLSQMSDVYIAEKNESEKDLRALDLPNSSTISSVLCQISDVEVDEDENNKLDMSDELCLVDTSKKGT
jgi:hypothetical protein